MAFQKLCLPNTPTKVFINSLSLIITTFKEEKLKYLYSIQYILKKHIKLEKNLKN